jgi:FKBP12-rapamycin complex-associated protein
VATRSDLLPHMFGAGLSPTLCAALTDLARHAPALLPGIQERLLHVLSLVLAGRPFTHAGAAAAGGTGLSGSGGAGGGGGGGLGGSGQTSSGGSALSRKAKPSSSSSPLPAGAAPASGPPSNADPELVRLALHTLGEFDFRGIVLTEFVRDSLVLYLDDDNTAIRVEAALTCAKLMAQTGGEHGDVPTRGHAAAVIGDVLEKLLVVGISDPDPAIRRAVLAALGPRTSPIILPLPSTLFTSFWLFCFCAHLSPHAHTHTT